MTAISRRTFVGGSLAAVAAFRYGRASPLATPTSWTCKAPTHRRLVAAVFAALGGIGKFVKKGDFVIIKPNAAFANPAEWGTTTHPQTVLAVAKMCLDAKAKGVMILEYPQAKGEMCLKRCGLSEAMATLPAAKIKLLSGSGDFQKTEVKGGVSLKTTDVAKSLLSADVFINLPAAKAHYQSGVSLGLKNHMGLVFDRQIFHTALDLHQAIADLGRIIKPNLTIIDGTRALLTNVRRGQAIRRRQVAWWPGARLLRSTPTD